MDVRPLGFILAVLLVLMPGVAAPEETFDLATFEAPAGWTRLPLPDVLLFRAPAADGQLALFPSIASPASPTDNFKAEWARLVTATLGPADPAQVSSEQTPDGWTAVIGISEIRRDAESVYVLLVTTTGFGRAMSVVATLGRQEQVPEVTRFFERISFRVAASAPATPGTAAPPATPAPAPPAESTEVVAVTPGGFAGEAPTGLFYRVTAGFGTYSRVTAETRLFLPGNRIVRAFPFGGGDRFAMARCLPDQCGTYRLDPGYLTATWGNRQVDRWTLKRASDGVDIDGVTFRPARAVPAARLFGRWSAASSDGNPYANVFTFERDGTFTFGTSSATRLNGRFAVEGMTLILRFADGSEERRTLFVASSGEQIGLICINNEVFSG
jgi:hypothetical protein